MDRISLMLMIVGALVVNCVSGNSTVTVNIHDSTTKQVTPIDVTQTMESTEISNVNLGSTTKSTITTTAKTTTAIATTVLSAKATTTITNATTVPSVTTTTTTRETTPNAVATSSENTSTATTGKIITTTRKNTTYSETTISTATETSTQTEPSTTAISTNNPTRSSTSESTSTVSETTTKTTIPGTYALVWAIKRPTGTRNSYQGRLVSANVTAESTLSPTTLFSGSVPSEFWALASDYHRKLIYYTDYKSNYLGVYDVTNKTHRKLFEGLSFGIDGIAVDWFTGNLYWTDTDIEWIFVTDPDLNYHTAIIKLSTSVPALLALNPFTGSLYWTEVHKSFCNIYTSDLSGKNIQRLHSFTETLSIDAVVLDIADNRLYWSERVRRFWGYRGRIRSFDLNSPINVTLHYTSYQRYLMGLTSDKNHLYFTSVTDKKIYSLNKKTNAVTVVYTDTSSIPRAMTAYGIHNQPWSLDHHEAHPCLNHNCSQLCLTESTDKHICACAMGFNLQSDGVTCNANILHNNFMLVLDSQYKRIYQMSLDNSTSLTALPINYAGNLDAVTYDFLREQVYWSDRNKKSVSRCFLNGTKVETFATNIITLSMAIEPVSRNIYMADALTDTIVVASLDLPNIKSTLHIKDVYRLWSIRVSDRQRKVFWTDWGQVSSNGSSVGRIESINFDGSERKIEVGNTLHPHALAIDDQNNLLFVNELFDKNFYWYHLDTKKRGQFKVKSSNNLAMSVLSMSYHSGYLYLVTGERSGVFRLSVTDVMNGSTSVDLEPFGPQLFYKIAGLHVVRNDTNASSGPSPCSLNRGGCPEICLPKNNAAVCVCDDRSTYVSTNNTCTQVQSGNDTEAPSFGNTCPRRYNFIIVDECSNAATFNFVVPTATDNSGKVVVKALLQQPPPYQLVPGQHIFQYRAQDLNGNFAYCTFLVQVRAPSSCINKPAPPRYGTSSTPTCGSQYGSTFNVFCNATPEIVYQYNCNRYRQWISEGDVVCPVPSTTPKPAPQSSGVNGGVIAVIVIILIIVIVVVGIILIRRYNGVAWFTSKIFWSRGEDTIELTGDSHSKNWFPTSDGNVYS